MHQKSVIENYNIALICINKKSKSDFCKNHLKIEKKGKRKKKK